MENAVEAENGRPTLLEIGRGGIVPQKVPRGMSLGQDEERGIRMRIDVLVGACIEIEERMYGVSGDETGCGGSVEVTREVDDEQEPLDPRALVGSEVEPRKGGMGAEQRNKVAVGGLKWGGRTRGGHCQEANIGGKGAGRLMRQGDDGAGGDGVQQDRGGSSRVVGGGGCLAGRDGEKYD
ncbi:hypothetical protein DFH08DRAFT_1008242 [Mycena albidolilacea]|uniref:Uncharacterized protein n=1 Tax=Mycena albidolilacea TaxID=1033008 RepID=A0AAD6ZYT9_9AGAR|nr:hypothetical protein DFH08DRAFT_1008242 [Mycena albidolilacea]